MTNKHANTSEVVSLPRAARILGVPAKWLREEIEAGRLPGLRAGRQTILVHTPTVAALLAERARDGGDK